MAARTSVPLPQNQGPEPFYCFINGTEGSKVRIWKGFKSLPLASFHSCGLDLLLHCGGWHLTPLNGHSILACNNFLSLSPQRRMDNSLMNQILSCWFYTFSRNTCCTATYFFIRLVENGWNLGKSNQDNLQNCLATTVFHANC